MKKIAFDCLFLFCDFTRSKESTKSISEFHVNCTIIPFDDVLRCNKTKSLVTFVFVTRLDRIVSSLNSNSGNRLPTLFYRAYTSFRFPCCFNIPCPLASFFWITFLCW